ncbi:MAG TPA: biotin--[acetyl-CoA-carboxylase] ligase [Acidisoma sp.]|uniref:biotin--[acetyl-CoA-carboxylase] ligase n=1 Tax=Acidisoma sp. TaxID=1872115 RepID=UPI002CE22C04|nr:biotin--[acetyl-CoA-carboxylase] ligase [Acidisoma sp.]HTI00414.1 biotin--[acetyl-CoA-carboxylase] ligase [Acidisoma sp.]
MRAGEGPPVPLPRGYRLDDVALIPSTSDACVARAHAGEPDGLAILAAGQTAARGSRGRSWSCPPGNLYLSVLLRPRNAFEAGGAGQWALLVGCALIEALRAFDGAPGLLQLKWPNDVLRDGAKLAGILIDAAMSAEGAVDWLVAGVGANLAVAPAVEGRQTAALVSPSGKPPSPRAVTEVFLARLEAWRGRLADEGFASVRSAWLAAAHPIGTPVTIKDARRSRQGAFAGLSEEGALLLSVAGELGGEITVVSTGDVLLGQEG